MLTWGVLCLVATSHVLSTGLGAEDVMGSGAGQECREISDQELQRGEHGLWCMVVVVRVSVCVGVCFCARLYACITEGQSSIIEMCMVCRESVRAGLCFCFL